MSDIYIVAPVVGFTVIPEVCHLDPQWTATAKRHRTRPPAAKANAEDTVLDVR